MATSANQPTGDPGGLIRVRVDVSYDGTAYSGWARQPDVATVQGVLEDALGTCLVLSGAPCPVSLTVAGRTDAGVHARGQVCHADIPTAVWRRRGAGALLGHLNSLLPQDVRVGSLVVAPDGFDARFSALSRRYQYRIRDDRAAPDPLERWFVVPHRRALDLAAMNTAGQDLLGEHDFAAYCRPRVGASMVRSLLDLRWERDDRRRAVMTIESDAFCHSMVRFIVGALVAVGEGRRDVEWPGRVLASGVRDSAVTAMPPQGLVLELVRYPDNDLLRARAEQTRRRRDPVGEARSKPTGPDPS